LTQYKAYTVWSRDQNGKGQKQYWWMVSMTKPDLRKKLEAEGCTDVLIWSGNWFGLTESNRPQPDITYGIIPEEQDAGLQ
jgi:hypothetical protein